MPYRPIAKAAMFAWAAGLLAFLPAASSVGAERETITPAFREALPNVPGKVLVGVVVAYPPGVSTPSHRHARSAFVTGYVLSGAIRSQVDDQPPRVFQAGESFTENPGAHHRISENASKTDPARLLAIFVVDAADTELTTLDR